ncbi:hypothetical protein [Ancylomarina longa]|uniref:Uncharacterized protein n=1 Tax=Ancylomarina longa TaxID=2487017 RepID=A0A434AGY6_9BACT|nr:hypothetical protein [Ancylomarina longa]RUT73656.1 hypothetical protein DLK05_12585 [Ancylomarina longa]
MKTFALILFLFSAFVTRGQKINGTVTVQVSKYCEIIVNHPDRPIHFTYNRKWQHHTKRVRVKSNCKWILSVRPQERYLYCNHYKIDANLISYRIGNAQGSGDVQSPEASYLLYQLPYNPPFGTGNVIFDVIFSLDTSLLRKVRWGNYNTKVDITCTPDTN